MGDLDAMRSSGVHVKKPAVPGGAGLKRVGAIDAGSNALRFIAAEASPGASPEGYRVLATSRVPLRLGADAFSRGELAPRTLDETARCLAAFAGQMTALGVEASRTVGTSALRECRNSPELVRRARLEAGLELEVISGSEEIRLVHLAVRHRLEGLPEPWIQVELGGGSVEIALADRGGVRWSETHPLGAVRLLEVLGIGRGDPRQAYRLAAGHIDALRVPDEILVRRPGAFVATGGNIDALARQWGREDAACRSIGVDDLGTAIEQLAGLTVEDRMQRLGFAADRADVILPAALVYHRLASRAGVDRILAPGVGVREGILLELLAGGEALRDHPDRALAEACLRLGNRHGHDEAHARQVARLADRLFLDLAPLHGLGDDARRLLAAAALLHDIGVSVGDEDHHKHSLSLISAAELPGLSIEQVQVVANVARYHRKGLPTTDHEAFARLDDGRRAVVSRLAALLRIADALDRRHGSLVRSLHATARAREVELAVEAAADLAEERGALGRKADLFTELYGRRVVVTGGGAGP